MQLLVLGLLLPVCLVGAGIVVALIGDDGRPPKATLGAVASLDSALSSGQPAVAAPIESQFAGRMQSGSLFAWPASGQLTSYLGPGHPTGIDIGLKHDEDSLIRAAAPGVVTFAGGSSCCDYGLHVEIEHEDGWSTLYAHLSIVGARVGQRVEQGTLLGLGGSTGFSEGKHLHFEVIRDETYYDPLRFLPPDQGKRLPGVPFGCPEAPIAVDPAGRSELQFTSVPLANPRLVGATVEPVASGEGEPPVQASPEGRLSVVVETGAPETASGRAFDYALALSFASDSGAMAEVTCTLRLKTMQSFPTLTRYTRPIATPTRKPPTKTPTRVPPTATATRSLATRTPTPNGILKVATPSSQMPGVPTALPTATKTGGSSTSRTPVAPTATPKR